MHTPKVEDVFSSAKLNNVFHNNAKHCTNVRKNICLLRNATDLLVTTFIGFFSHSFILFYSQIFTLDFIIWKTRIHSQHPFRFIFLPLFPQQQNIRFDMSSVSGWKWQLNKWSRSNATWRCIKQFRYWTSTFLRFAHAFFVALPLVPQRNKRELMTTYFLPEIWSR